MRTRVFLLPKPPSINDYYIKGRVLSKKAREYRLEVKSAIGYQLPFLGDVGIEIVVDSSRDIDNGLKALLDALQFANVFANDKQVHKLQVTKMKRRCDNVSVCVRSE